MDKEELLQKLKELELRWREGGGLGNGEYYEGKDAGEQSPAAET